MQELQNKVNAHMKLFSAVVTKFPEVSKNILANLVMHCGLSPCDTKSLTTTNKDSDASIYHVLNQIATPNNLYEIDFTNVTQTMVQDYINILNKLFVAAHGVMQACCYGNAAYECARNYMYTRITHNTAYFCTDDEKYTGYTGKFNKYRRICTDQKHLGMVNKMNALMDELEEACSPLLAALNEARHNYSASPCYAPDSCNGVDGKYLLSHWSYQYEELQRLVRRRDSFDEFQSTCISERIFGISSCGTHVFYFQNEADKQRARYTMTRFGRWLRRSDSTLTDDEVNDYACVFKTLDVQFVTSEEEITAAYADSDIDSCMAHSFDDLPHHPAAVYSENDRVALAVLKTVSGAVIARAVVNTANKTYCNVYGDYSLAAKLKELDYSYDSDYLDGENLRLLRDGTKIIVPYLDGCADNFDVGDDYITVCHCGEYDASETCGYVRDFSNTAVCERCRDREDEDTMSDVHTYSTNSTVIWCEHCTEHYAIDAITEVSSDGLHEEALCAKDDCTYYEGAWVHDDVVSEYREFKEEEEEE